MPVPCQHVYPNPKLSSAPEWNPYMVRGVFLSLLYKRGEKWLTQNCMTEGFQQPNLPTLPCPTSILSCWHRSAQMSPSHEEKGLVTIEHFVGCAESVVLILNKPCNKIAHYHKSAC